MVTEFTEARQNGSAELYQKFCEYLDAQVSKAVLGQTLTTEMPASGGSRAAAEVHESVRRDILNADARRLAATLERDLVRPIVELNMGPQAHYPKIELGLPDDGDVKVFAEIVAMLADRGLRVGQKTILDKLGIAEASATRRYWARSRARGNRIWAKLARRCGRGGDSPLVFCAARGGDVSSRARCRRK